MKYFYSLPGLLLLCLGALAQGTTTATYNLGDIASELVPNPSTNNVSSCFGSLTVNVPAGRYVTAVDVEYRMEAPSGFGGWLSEQASYLECATTSTKESSITPGPVINSPGTHNYFRNGLILANGIVPAGGLTFNLHVFRTWGGSGCNTNFQKVQNNTFKITVHHSPPPTCPPPSAVVVNSVLASSVNLGWTSGGATDWQIEYGPQGFTPGTGTIVNATSNPFILSGLTPGTSYQYRLRDSCGVADVSFWTPLKSFRTTCAITNAPWTEDFESVDWVASTFGNVGSIDTCFSRNHNNNFTWETGPPQFPSFNSGPSGDHTTGSGKYIFSEISGFTPGGDSAIITTPSIDLSSLNIPELSFWYHMYGGSIGTLRVGISNNGGASYNTLFSVSGQQQNAKAAPWLEKIINLSAYANDTVSLKFVVSQVNFGTNGDVAIDDIDIHEQPSCPKPSGLSALPTADGFILNWTSGGASDWQIEYGPQGFTPGTGTIVNASTNPFTLSGLSPNTNYDVRLRDSCGVNDVSVWTLMASFRTACSLLSAPWIEDFESSDWVASTFGNVGSIDTCFSRNHNNNFTWETGPPQFSSFNSGPSGDHTTGSGKYIFSEISGFTPGGDSAVITTPSIDLSSLNIPELSFWYHMYGGSIGTLRVGISNNGGASYNTVFSVSGQQQNAKAAPWLEKIINLSAYANDTVSLKFVVSQVNFGTNGDVAIDDIDIHEQPSCPKPSGLSALPTADGFILNWTSGGASDWQIEYGPQGFTPGTGTIVNASTNPFTLSGLSPNTNYDVRLRDSCGVNDVSVWTLMASFRTACSLLSAPWIEDFESSDWVASNFFNVGDIDTCYTRNYSNLFTWETGPPQFPSFNSGPSGDHTTGSGKYIFSELSGFSPNGDSATIVTPEIDLSSLTTPELSFWYHMYGGSIGTLRVGISNNNGASYATIFSISSQQQSSKSAPWLEKIINLSAYTNDTVSLKFVVSQTTFGANGDVAIDDIDIHELPSCPKPSDLNSTSRVDGFIMSWTSGGASDWEIEYGPKGFTPGSGTRITVSSNPYTLSGLSPNTVYDLYVRDSCGVADVSAWSAVKTDTTLCSVFATPFTENFDGTDWTQSFIFNNPGDIDNCWSRSDTLAFVWKVRQGPTNLAFSGPDADHTTGNAKYLFTDRTSGNPLSTSISSPAFDLNGLSVPELRFWYHMYGSGIDKMEVEVLSGTTWTNVATINGQQQTSKTDPWEEQVISLSSYANDTIQVRIKGFRTASGFFNNLAIDDFWIGEAPTCPRPSNLSVSNITTTGMTLSWTTGGASNWQVMYRPSGSTGPFTMVSASTNPFAVTGLNPATTYEFWVRDSCGPGDVSFWLGPVYGTTLCGVIIAPWIEDFNASVWVQGAAFDNAGNQISSCWTRPNASNPNFGPRNGATGSTGTGPNNDVWGVGSYIYTEASGAPGAGQITSPSIHVPANLLSPRLKFAYHMYGANIIDLKVQVTNGSGFTNVRTITGPQQTSNAAPWTFDSISLGSYSGDTIQIRFIGTNSGFRGDVALDNVEVTGQVLQCPEPSNITFSAITPISADVSWSSPSGVSELELVPTGQAQGTGTLFQGVSSTFSLTGLTPATTYIIYLRDSCGSNNYSVWITDTLTTLNCPVVTAGFSQNANLLTLNFNSTATAADSVYWDFGDGNSSSLGNPSHTYANPGSYSVSQRAYNNCGNGDTLTISINVCDSLIANYTHFQSGDTVFFDGSGSVGANEYLWYFGNADTATGATVNRIFASSGTKQVSLIVTNACNDTVIVTKNIKVCGPPQAIWTYTNLGTTGSGMKIEFDASASVNATQYEWDFGDGNTNSGSVKPVHTYITPGLFYFVKLTVTNSCGDKNSWRYRLSEIGLEELDLASSLELYPNPATQSIFLEWSYQDYRAQQVSIIDARGRLVMQKKIAERQNERLELDVSGLAPGYYSIDLSTNQGSARKAFLKK